ncbi:hypothetical protein [Rhizobium leucaenae]|uniref:hypothetical protein n=1 Tax=Rhizobium leucaenae TaxID=29450 RepID=UPI0007EE8256|nr:hypothetical protein [Rhizobium leucaenae]
MTTTPETTCDCTFFDEGDWVESRLNTDVFGIVVGEADFGRYYNVQLAGSMEIKQFFAVTLRHMDVQEDEPPMPAKAKEDNENVVRVDFTKGARLRPDSKTEGAA